MRARQIRKDIRGVARKRGPGIDCGAQIKADILMGRSDHHAAIAGLPDCIAGKGQERWHPLRHQDLPALGCGECGQAQRCRQRIRAMACREDEAGCFKHLAACFNAKHAVALGDAQRFRIAVHGIAVARDGDMH